MSRLKFTEAPQSDELQAIVLRGGTDLQCLFRVYCNDNKEELSEDYVINGTVIVKFLVTIIKRNRTKPNLADYVINVYVRKDSTFNQAKLRFRRSLSDTEDTSDDLQENGVWREYERYYINNTKPCYHEFLINVTTFLIPNPIYISRLHEDEGDFILSGEDGSITVHKQFLGAISSTFRDLLKQNLETPRPEENTVMQRKENTVMQRKENTFMERGSSIRKSTNRILSKLWLKSSDTPSSVKTNGKSKQKKSTALTSKAKAGAPRSKPSSPQIGKQYLAQSRAIASQQVSCAIYEPVPSTSRHTESISSIPSTSRHIIYESVIPSTSKHIQSDGTIPSTSKHIESDGVIPSTTGHIECDDAIPSTSKHIENEGDISSRYSDAFDREYLSFEFGKWTRESENKAHIKGASVTTLAQFKAFMYCDSPPRTHFKSVLLFANIYNLFNLERYCAYKIMETFNEANAYDLLKFAFESYSKILTQKIMFQISKNGLNINDVEKHLLFMDPNESYRRSMESVTRV